MKVKVKTKRTITIKLSEEELIRLQEALRIYRQLFLDTMPSGTVVPAGDIINDILPDREYRGGK